jgi:hypothetical protein
MFKVTWTVLLASALLIGGPFSGYAAGGSASVGSHVGVGQAAWGGHPPGGGGPPPGGWAHPYGGWGHPPSGGWGHHGGGSQFFFGGSVVLGPWWPWYPYYPYYSYYPYYPYYAPAPAAVVQQQSPVDAQPASSQADYWYYCQDPQGHYPYVQSCPGGWMKVVPQTAPPQQ